MRPYHADELIIKMYEHLFQNMYRRYAQMYICTYSIGIVILLNGREKGSLTFILESHFYGWLFPSWPCANIF